MGVKVRYARIFLCADASVIFATRKLKAQNRRTLSTPHKKTYTETMANCDMNAVRDWFIMEMTESDGGEIIITDDEAIAIWNDGFLEASIKAAYIELERGGDFGDVWESIWIAAVAWVKTRRAM